MELECAGPVKLSWRPTGVSSTIGSGLLKQRLSEVQKSREVRRTARKGQFKASLVGYTNAGKSSILKALSGAESIFVEDRLFATLDPLTRDIHLAENTSGPSH